MAHTKTPWHLHDMEYATLCGPDHMTIGITETRRRSETEDIANAHLIVRAVNAFKPMRDALKAFVDAAQSWHEFHNHTDIQCDELCAKITPARAALALADKDGQ